MKLFGCVQQSLDSFVKKWSKLTSQRQEEKRPRVKEENIMFMSFIIRVNLLQPKWHKALLQILGNTKVRSFKMDRDGIAEVSGIGDPNMLLTTVQKLGKKVELCWFQHGKCSTNLFGPSGKDAIEVPRPQPKSSSSFTKPTLATDQAPVTEDVATTAAAATSKN